jgi:AraC-like DNA-binding protein/ligand-binding sensor protein
MEYSTKTMDYFANLAIFVQMKYPMKYIFRKEVQDILDIFTDLFDIRIAFFSSQGDELKVGKRRGLCEFCDLLRSQLAYEPICLDLDRKMRDRAMTEKKMIHYQCHSGMMEAITPIYIEENLIGFLMVGQFRINQEPLKQTMRIKWRETVGTDELETAFLITPCFTEEHAMNILKLFNVLVDHILYRHMIEFHGSNSVQPLVHFLQGHLEENLDIAEGAKILMQSKSSLAHKFKNITGKSFKQYQIDLKLEKADEYFRKQPELTIREVAHRLGYEDPYYFSRLYKKHRGQSPLKAKKSLQ